MDMEHAEWLENRKAQKKTAKKAVGAKPTTSESEERRLLRLRHKHRVNGEKKKRDVQMRQMGLR